MVNVPLKKKCGRLARLGEQPLHSKYKNKGGERFCTQKNSPPPLIQKRELTKACGFCSPKPLLVAFCFHFWCFYSLQQVSIQSLSFLLPIGVFSSSFGALNCENVLIFVGQFWVALMLDLLSWEPPIGHPTSICV